MATFVKQRPDAPRGFFAVEAAGLRWLAQASAQGGAPVAEPIGEVGADATRIALTRIATISPNSSAAQQFGRQLAFTHAAGANAFGSPPYGWGGDGFIGPLRLPHNRSGVALQWGSFFATYRIAPFARAARDRGALTAAAASSIDRLCERLEDGDEQLCGPAEPVARLHGDLWSGNVLWSTDGVVLIDPAAHGGHRESDLGMLALFGLPYLDRVLAAYDEAVPLADGWRGRVGIHQLHPLLVHAVLFGAGYGDQAAMTAACY